MSAAKSILAAAVLALGWASEVHAQQFPMGKQSYDVMGLSAACTSVLNTELAHCDTLLFQRTDRSIDNVVDVLPRAELDLICKPQCREELSALREKIVATCTSPEDVMRHAGLEFPPVLFADKFAYTFDLNCYKHKTTGRFCDEVWAEWRAGTVAVDRCDDCFLGPMAVQLASPIGVSAQRVADFDRFMSSCKDASYQFTTATAYARPAATTRTAVAVAAAAAEEISRPCERSYTVAHGDTCTSIALSQNASTFDVIQINAIDIYCAVMPKEGTKLCLDRPCDTYTIRHEDTCEDIAQRFAIKPAHVRLLNPMLDSNCSNIERWEGFVACVGPASLVASRVEAAAPPPRPTTSLKPLAPGSSDKCVEFANGRAVTDPDVSDMYENLPEYMCQTALEALNACSPVASNNGIHVPDLLRLNPSLEGKRPCQLEGSYSYCVLEEGMPTPVRDEFWTKRWAQRWG